MKHRHNPHETEDRARLILAIVVSLLILFGFNHFIEKPQIEKRIESAGQKTAVETAKTAKTEILPRAQALEQSRRVPIRGAKITGSLSLKGARIDDVTLNDYYKAVDRREHVELMTPSGAEHAFFAESGWIAKNKAVPTAETLWQKAQGSADEIVSGGKPVVLVWNNGQGIVFEKSFSLDEKYLFTITSRVTNNSGADIAFNTYQLISRHGVPEDYQGFFVLHEGPVGYLGKKLHEPQYADLLEGEKLETSGTGGWLGITDKYWMVTMLPDSAATFDARVIGSGDPDVKHDHVGQSFQADIVSEEVSLASGKTSEETTHLYAGIKDADVMEAYMTTYGFKHLDLAIDFGIWHYITRPFYFALHLLFDFTGHIGLAILTMTVLVRACVFPLASKSFRSMARMKTLTPKMKELQEKHSADKTKLQMEIYELYKRENVNPMSGCWPMLIQIPIFFALYKVILISVELRHAPFWGWIHDLSAPDPTTIFNLFGAIPWDPPQMMMVGAWPLLYIVTMTIQMRLSPPAPDPNQQMVQNLMPLVFGVMLAQFASGLVIYWTWSNVLGIAQQYYIQKSMGDTDVSLIRGHSGRHKKKKGKA